MSRSPKFLLLLPVVIAALVLGACGDSHSKVTTGTYAGESGKNAPYLNVGPLIYEVQLSRELNPANPEDAGYLEGLTPAERKLGPGQEWFAVFLQVYNNTSIPQQAAHEITISDTQANIYSPIVPGETNPYAYRAERVPAKGQLPQPGTTAAQGPSAGQMLLFKIQIVSLDNRPLEIKIVNPEDPGESAQAELDV